MGDFIREAGWPIYLVILFAAVSIPQAIKCVVLPRANARLFAASALAMFTAALVGLFFGLDATLCGCEHVEEARRIVFFLKGLHESMRSLELALAVGTIEAALFTAGQWRARAGGAGGAMPADL